MDAILRAATIYVGIFIILRATGKRSLAEITTFDFVLLLIISEATQQGMLGEDFSLTTAFLAVITLVGIDLGLSLITYRSPVLDKIVNGVPVVLVVDGEPLRDRMLKVRVNDDDIMEQARLNQGLERMEQIKYAVLEKGGGISIVPRE